MSSIHLLARRNRQLPTAYRHLGDGVQLSGWWAVSETDAQRLVGGTLHLHDAKADMSWVGGAIVAYEVAAEGAPDAGRIGFHFRPNAGGRDVIWNWGGREPNASVEKSLVFP